MTLTRLVVGRHFKKMLSCFEPLHKFLKAPNFPSTIAHIHAHRLNPDHRPSGNYFGVAHNPARVFCPANALQSAFPGDQGKRKLGPIERAGVKKDLETRRNLHLWRLKAPIELPPAFEKQ